MTPRHLPVTLLVAVVALGCGDEQHVDLPKDQVWTSAHFRYGARAGDTTVCSAVVDQLEVHLQALGSYLGLDWSGGEIGYYKFRDADDFHANSGCHPAAAACAKPTDVRSTRPLHGHELVHVYTGPLGHPPALLEEGVADALAPEGRSFRAPVQTWRELLATPRQADGTWPDIEYSAGAWFVTYLLRAFGATPFVAFYRGASANHSANALAGQFHDAYGLDLDETWRQAQAAAPRLAGVPIWECASAQPMVLGADAIPTLDRCDGRGPWAGLVLPQATTLTWTDDSWLDFSILGCPPDDGRYMLFDDYRYHPGAITLPAGSYYVASGLLREKNQLRDGTGLLDVDCGSLLPITLGPDVPGPIVLTLANSTAPWFAVLQHPDGGSFRLWSYPPSQRPIGEVSATVEVCETCAGPCQLVETTPQQVANGVVLRLTNLASFEGAAVARLMYSW